MSNLLRDLLASCLSSKALIVGLAIFASACAQDSKSPAKSDRVRYVPVYDESACSVPKAKGSEARVPSSTSYQPVRSDFFGKIYDRSMLDGVMTASAVSTGRYVSSVLGGRLYKIPRDSRPDQGKICPMFTELTEAPEDYRYIWDKYSNVGEGGWMLAGLYFEDCGRGGQNCDDHRVIQPTILIDESRDRWTLVHEMMHFNFDQERKRDANMIGDTALQTGAEGVKSVVKSSYVNYTSTGERTSLATLQAQSSWLVQTYFYEMMVRSSIEEVSVEGILLDQFTSKRFENVAKESACNALRYMRKAEGIVSSEYEAIAIKADTPSYQFSLSSLSRYIEAEAREKGWSDIEAQATADRQFMEKMLARIRVLIMERETRFQKMPGANCSRELQRESVSRGQEALNLLDFVSKPVLDGEIEAHIDHLPGLKKFNNWKDK